MTDSNKPLFEAVVEQFDDDLVWVSMPGEYTCSCQRREIEGHIPREQWPCEPERGQGCTVRLLELNGPCDESWECSLVSVAQAGTG